MEAAERLVAFPAREVRPDPAIRAAAAELMQREAWAAAIEEGRWPEQVRPYTSNRQHVLRKVV